MWILPSRSRPQNLLRFFDAFARTKADTPGLVVLDYDDPLLDGYRAVTLPPGWSLILEPKHETFGALQNSVFDRWPHNEWYGMIADDVVPLSDGWDKKLVETAGIDGVSYGYDSINQGRSFTHGVLGGDFVRDLGWLILPGLDRLYGDNVIIDLAKEKGVLRYCPDVILEHLHFSNGKAPMDETYRKNNATNDREIYEAWKASRPHLYKPSDPFHRNWM